MVLVDCKEVTPYSWDALKEGLTLEDPEMGPCQISILASIRLRRSSGN